MKKANFSYLTLIIATGALLSLVAGVIVDVVTHSLSINLLIVIGIILAIVTIPGILLVIIQTAQEKQPIKTDHSNVTTVTKSIMGRIRITEGPVTIEAPDAESAVKAWQGIHENLMKSENLLKIESQGTMEQTKPEAPDVPDTKETEK